jgi:hypothetical protein
MKLTMNSFWVGLSLKKNNFDIWLTPIGLIYLIVFYDICTSNLNQLVSLSAIKFDFINYPKTLFFFHYFSADVLNFSLLVANLAILFVSFGTLQNRKTRAGIAIVYILTKGYIFSLSYFSHIYWPVIWSLPLLAMPKQIVDLKSKETLNALRLVLIISLAFYFYPGFWKIFYGFTTGTFFDINYGPNVIAKYLLTVGKKSILSEFLVSHPLLANLGLVVVILVQLASPLAILNKGFLRFYVLAIFIFHFINNLVLQINFYNYSFILLILGLWGPDGLTLEKKFSWMGKKTKL